MSQNISSYYMYFFLQAFFSKEYITDNPNDQPLITELKELIVEQVGVTRDIQGKTLLNPFVHNAPFLYSLMYSWGIDRVH